MEMMVMRIGEGLVIGLTSAEMMELADKKLLRVYPGETKEKGLSVFLFHAETDEAMRDELLAQGFNVGPFIPQ